MKKLIYTLLLLLVAGSPFAQEREHKKLFVAVASSGPGGAILGHSYLVFCPEHPGTNFRSCEAIEYNLDINLGEKAKELSQKSLFEKVSAFNNSRFLIFRHSDASVIAKKYIDRGQKITYYDYKYGEAEVQSILADILEEKAERDFNEYRDYDIFSNNCATKIIDLISRYHPEVNINYKNFTKSRTLTRYFSNFPILMSDVLEETNLFDEKLIMGTNYAEYITIDHFNEPTPRQWDSNPISEAALSVL